MKVKVDLVKTRINLFIPHWSQLVRSKWLWVGTALIFFLVWGSLSLMDRSKPVMLLANGNPLAVVTGEKQVLEAIEKAKKELEQERGITISGFTTELTYDSKPLKEDHKPITEKELQALVKDKLDWLAECWTIKISGKPDLKLVSRQEAEDALQGIREYYLPADKDKANFNVEKIAFVEEVTVAPGQGPINSLKNKDEAIEAMVKGLDKIVQQTVQRGDSLWSIARANKMTVSELREANRDLKGDVLKPGQQLNLVKSEPLLTVIHTFTTTLEEKVPYKTIYEYDATIWRGQQQVTQAGVNGSREVTYRITMENDVEVERETLAEKLLRDPVSRIVRVGTKKMVASRGDGGNGQLGWPTRGRITSPYGKRGREFHTGVDIAGDTGDPVYAAESGVVLSAGWAGNLGRCIVIDHGRGLSTRYAHLNSMDVSVGQTVTRGSIIGTIGSTGRSTGPHLHFEVRINDEPHNPLGFLER